MSTRSSSSSSRASSFRQAGGSGPAGQASPAPAASTRTCTRRPDACSCWSTARELYRESGSRGPTRGWAVRVCHGEYAHAVCLDFPFSLVADAVLLPVTVPWSIVNWTRPGSDRPASGAIEQCEGRESRRGSSDRQGRLAEHLVDRETAGRQPLAVGIARQGLERLAV